jgi:hypothetical protein
MIDALIAWASAHPSVAAVAVLATLWLLLVPKGQGGSTVGMDGGPGGGGGGDCGGDGGGDGGD